MLIFITQFDSYWLFIFITWFIIPTLNILISKCNLYLRCKVVKFLHFMSPSNLPSLSAIYLHTILYKYDESKILPYLLRVGGNNGPGLLISQHPEDPWHLITMRSLLPAPKFTREYNWLHSRFQSTFNSHHIPQSTSLLFLILLWHLTPLTWTDTLETENRQQWFTVTFQIIYYYITI